MNAFSYTMSSTIYDLLPAVHCPDISHTPSNSIKSHHPDLSVSISPRSLTIGDSGTMLMEDFHHLDKQAHFNRERVPERVVHAKGTGAHGYFEVTKFVYFVPSPVSIVTQTNDVHCQVEDICVANLISHNNIKPAAHWICCEKSYAREKQCNWESAQKNVHISGLPKIIPKHHCNR